VLFVIRIFITRLVFNESEYFGLFLLEHGFVFELILESWGNLFLELFGLVALSSIIVIILEPNLARLSIHLKLLEVCLVLVIQQFLLMEILFNLGLL